MYRVGALMSLLLLGACTGEGKPAGKAPPSMPPGEITTRADGVLRLEPPITDVATLQLQPDGTYKRFCGAPSPEIRAMLTGVAKARRARR